MPSLCPHVSRGSNFMFIVLPLSYKVFRNGLTFYQVHIQSQRLCRAKLGITYYLGSLILLILYRLYYTNTNFSEGIGTLFLKKNIKKITKALNPRNINVPLLNSFCLSRQFSFFAFPLSHFLPISSRYFLRSIFLRNLFRN